MLFFAVLLGAQFKLEEARESQSSSSFGSLPHCNPWGDSISPPEYMFVGTGVGSLRLLPNQVQIDLISQFKSNWEEQAESCCVLLLIRGVTCLLQEQAAVR